MPILHSWTELYLGLELVANTAVGVSNLLTEPITSEKVIGCLQPVHSFKYTSFLSAGDRRTTLANLSPDDLKTRFKDVFLALQDLGSMTIIDCRGGIDAESLAICSAVDNIVLIVESDTTSFQASRD